MNVVDYETIAKIYIENDTENYQTESSRGPIMGTLSDGWSEFINVDALISYIKSEERLHLNKEFKMAIRIW